MILEIKDLNISYGAIRAVRGVSLSVPRGSIVSLIGANGAGKSSILNALSGLINWQGAIQFDGQDLRGKEAHQIVRLGLVQSPEGRGIFPSLTVLENLELGAFTRSNRAEVKEDLEFSFSLFPKLRERVKQYAGTLSGGEQQMLAMCRALMSRPKLLLLDEPSLGLAPLVVQQIFQIIQQINKKGVSILLVEQNARMALKISDHAYVLETGSITMKGAGSELLHDERVRQAYLGG